MIAARKTSSPIRIWTYDWVPAKERGPRGFVRDLRLRWALEEAGIDYEVCSTPFATRAQDILDRQPFGQVPFLEDGDVTLFESGACLLYLGRKSEALMPRDPVGEAATLQWTIAAPNSIEMVSVPWWLTRVTGDENAALARWLHSRLNHLQAVLEQREWLAAGRFTIADILMADALRIPDVRDFAESPVLEAYIQRACARPAFQKAYNDQLEHFAAADRARG